MIKAIGENLIIGTGVVFGGVDLTGDRFTKNTDFGESRSFVGLPVYYDHSLGGLKSQIGAVKQWIPTDEGIDVEIELDRRHAYASKVMELVKRGALGLSTGALPHLVVRENGELKRWVIGEISLTPTPAEPRTVTAAIAGGNDGGTRPAEQYISMQSIKEQTTMSDFQFNESQVTDIVDKRLGELAGAPVAGGGVYMGGKAPNVKNVTTLGMTNEPEQVFWHWIKTGDEIAAKTTLVEGTGANGGYAAPPEAYREIIDRRDELSVLSKLPIRRMTTSYQRLDVPTQVAKSDFAWTAESGAYNFDEPTFGQAAIQVYTATLAMKISNQLLRDEKANLDAFLTREIARAAARNVNQYIISGSGSSQPYGILTRATQNEVLASASGLDFSDVINLEAAIPNSYLQENECGWIMRGTTLNAIRGLTGNIPQAGLLNVTRNEIDGYPLAPSDFIDALGTTNKPIIFGNFGYYMFVESVNMEIARNPYVYMANGQTGIFVTMRWGGDVTQAEAFAYGENP